MREIELRGKSCDEWVYGHLLKTEKDEVCCVNCESKHSNYLIQTDELDKYNEYDKYYITDDDTIGQYTGMKDKNGVKIFEGDILKIPEWLKEDIQDVCICIYNQENTVSDIIGFGLYIKDGYSGKYKILVQSDEWDEFEVIGNKFDNPELLMESD